MIIIITQKHRLYRCGSNSILKQFYAAIKMFIADVAEM